MTVSGDSSKGVSERIDPRGPISPAQGFHKSGPPPSLIPRSRTLTAFTSTQHSQFQTPKSDRHTGKLSERYVDMLNTLDLQALQRLHL